MKHFFTFVIEEKTNLNLTTTSAIRIVLVISH
ncbi:MAG: hypothetical protein JWQ28_2837 [Pedobacter sp.]|jgi:hypothetical protein|nr:hypothetical protein [Pedobacter sp.]